ncbi:MAG: hypothetical protein Q9163_004629 [Psora crenata]
MPDADGFRDVEQETKGDLENGTWLLPKEYGYRSALPVQQHATSKMQSEKRKGRPVKGHYQKHPHMLHEGHMTIVAVARSGWH